MARPCTPGGRKFCGNGRLARHRFRRERDGDDSFLLFFYSFILLFFYSFYHSLYPSFILLTLLFIVLFITLFILGRCYRTYVRVRV
jgi:hypothetical protein